ncbi:hypothetical protein, partial [Sinorhizobium meliloti]|uniref:hypothetical protein n=1 Tax=Rhizobium meliloti TaxID=382 RepID=UPI002E0E2564
HQGAGIFLCRRPRDQPAELGKQRSHSFQVGVDGQIDNNWSLKGSVKVNTGGNGHLVDYD